MRTCGVKYADPFPFHTNEASSGLPSDMNTMYFIHRENLIDREEQPPYTYSSHLVETLSSIIVDKGPL